MKYKLNISIFKILFIALIFTACGGSSSNSGGTGGTVVSIAEIQGITSPVFEGSPVTTINETAQYSGTVSWSGTPSIFAALTTYTATITLEAKTGYTLTGVAANYFTVAGATSVKNTADSGVVVAIFPETGAVAGLNKEYALPASVSFNMKYVPGGTFPTGYDDSGSETISTPYWMAETEVTYELWYAVRTWARANGYTLDANPGREGNDGTITAGSGADPTTAKKEPVTTINWREAMVWCNALTEYYNANNGTDTDLDCTYYTDSGYTTPIRSANDPGYVSYPDPGGQDDPYVKSTAKGFRLSGSMEWECAARYKDGTNWTAGGCASGGAGSYTGTTQDDYDNFNQFGWYGGVAVIPNGNTATTQAVAGKTANLLGIYDMSGNAYEWCFDWYPGDEGSYRVCRGGSYRSGADTLQVGYAYGYYSFLELNFVGFRIARTE